MDCKLAIVMPAYNEAACIEKVTKGWLSLLHDIFPDNKAVKLIVVNDGSKDNTGEILNSVSKTDTRLMVVHQANAGHGKALVNAYHQALQLGAEWVFHVDSDDQFVTNDFKKLWEKREESYFIMGYRKVRYDAFHRLVITRILRFSILFLYGCYVKDSNVPFRLIKGNYLKKLLQQVDFNPFAPNIFLAVLAAKDQQKLFFIPITHQERKTGTVSIVKWKLIKVCWISLKELIHFRLNLNKYLRALKTSEQKMSVA